MNMTKKIEFTNEAIKQIKKIILENIPKKYFRISVQGGGCSGFKYNFTFDDKKEKDDFVFDQTVIDKSSLDIIAGSTVDYKKEMIVPLLLSKIPKLRRLVAVACLFLCNENFIVER